MSKRGADKYITDRNWDEEEETEEAGVFTQADATTLERRQVKKAKRRGPETGETTSSGTGGVFAGFTGFSKTSSSSTTSAFSSFGAKPLAFSNGSSTSETKTTSPFGNLNSTETSPKPVFGAFSKTVSKSPEKSDSSPKKSPAATLTNGNGESSTAPASTRSKYLHQLKSLNEGVSKWIKEHVDKNPYCILTPIFKDYEKYISDLEEKYPASERNKSEEKPNQANDDAKEEIRTSKVDDTPVTKSDPPTVVAASGGFSDGTSAPGGTTSTAPVFKFGSGSLGGSTDTGGTTAALGTKSSGIFGGAPGSTGTTFSGFSFSSGSTSGTGSIGSIFGNAGTSGFSFGSAMKSGGQDKSSGGASISGGDEDEYVPPKDEVKQVEEDDSLYTKRCKLFFKKDDQWKEKGVGNLHLKPCEGKTQLLVRADTNLGNILLNIMLVSSLPVSRQGKNNITLVCVPNPPLDEKKPDNKTMVPMLIRVKTSEEADELFEKLKEHKS